MTGQLQKIHDAMLSDSPLYRYCCENGLPQLATKLALRRLEMPTQPCTCTGSCKGAEGLGSNWHCVVSDVLANVPEVELDTSPTSFGCEYDIPKGIRIETERWGRRWLCEVKGSTVSTIGGVVCYADKIWVVAKRNGLAAQVAALAAWLRRQGYYRCMESDMVQDVEVSTFLYREDPEEEQGYCPD